MTKREAHRRLREQVRFHCDRPADCDIDDENILNGIEGAVGHYHDAIEAAKQTPTRTARIDSMGKVDDRYIHLHLDPIEGVSHDSMMITVKLEDDGIIVDAWNNGECLATTATEWSELELPAGLIKTVNSGEYLQSMIDENEEQTS
tara:strand:+ start:198 stop:635 length:438 start_codon:yes stop_codon:yes gene_type:complete